MKKATKQAGSGRKAQISLEFLLLFAITLVVLTVFLLLSQEQASDVNRARNRADAINSVNDLASAAKQVYSQGTGAKKQVLVKLPQGYEADKSYVANRTIKMRVSGSDYLEVVDFEVRGSLPSTAGTHWVWVVSEGSRVSIGQMMLTLDKVTISLLMERNQTKNDSFSVMNVWSKPINITLAINWAVTNVTLETNPTSTELDPLESQTINLVFMADSKAVGYYTGVITATGNDGTTVESATLPITIEVIGFGVGVPPALRVTPSLLNASMQPNSSITRAFTVCTNIYTSLSDIIIAPSLGAPGSWVGAPASLGPLGSDECRGVNINVTVPSGTYSGIYTGYISFDGVGVSNAQDTVGVAINVGGAADDTEGPEVSGIGKVPVRSLVYDTITFYAVGDDRLHGNSSIKQCEMNIDGSGWLLMNPTDGVYDEPAENITYTYLGGVDFGAHTANMRCTDSRNNVGPTRAYQFKVMKPILFITKTAFWTWDEWDWITWLWIYESFWGYVWDFDIVSTSAVTGGSVDLSMYASVIMAEYTQSSTLTPTLLNYEAMGGSIMMAGKAVQHGPRDFGLSTGPGTGHSDREVDIINNDHFITTGYSLGDVTILTTNTPIYSTDNFAGTQLALSVYGSNKTVLGTSDHFMIWGPTRPYRLLSNGIDLTTKVVDYGIYNSEMQ